MSSLARPSFHRLSAHVAQRFRPIVVANGFDSWKCGDDMIEAECSCQRSVDDAKEWRGCWMGLVISRVRVNSFRELSQVDPVF